MTTSAKIKRPLVSQANPFDVNPTWLTAKEQAEWQRTKSILKCDDFAGHVAYSSAWILMKLVAKCWHEIEGQPCVIAGQKGVRVPNPNVTLLSHLIYQLNRLIRHSGFMRLDKEGGRGTALPAPEAGGESLDNLINKINRRSGMHRDAINPRRKDNVS